MIIIQVTNETLLGFFTKQNLVKYEYFTIILRPNTKY